MSTQYYLIEDAKESCIEFSYIDKRLTLLKGMFIVDGLVNSDIETDTFEELCFKWQQIVNTDAPSREQWVNVNDTTKTLVDYLLTESEYYEIKEDKHCEMKSDAIKKYRDAKEEKYETPVVANMITTDLGMGKHSTTVPPLNISDNTLKKQAEYNAAEFVKALYNGKKKVDTESNINSTNTNTVVKSEPYTLENFNADVQGVDADMLSKLLNIKQALLLISPPGTGKTTTAIALSKYIEEETNSSRVKIVSFNQFTSYSDIIGGYQKNADGDWVITKGSLFEMADKALADPGNTYIYINDEINRANTEAVYGEALTAMSQRGKGVLTNFGLELIIPENLWIIGTMNSTDSSITELDTALRDRFMIYEMQEVKLDVSKINSTTNKNLICCIEKVRDAIININSYLKEDNYKKNDNKIGNRALYGKYNTIDELILIVKYDIQPKVESKKMNLDEDACNKISSIFKELYKYLEEAKEWED